MHEGREEKAAIPASKKEKQGGNHEFDGDS